MPKYLVRRSCEYSLSLEAETLSDAKDVAREMPIEEWDVAWSSDEFEDENGKPVE